MESAIRQHAPDMEYLRSRKGDILRLAELRGARSIRIFGSVANGTANDSSDIDILVEMQEGRSLLDLAGFQGDLEDLLGRRVEVLTAPAIHWFIRDKVLSEAVPL